MQLRFRHKGLAEFYYTGSRKGVRPEHQKRLRLILGRLTVSLNPYDMDLPGLRLHRLKGECDGFWSVQVSGNWRVIFKHFGDSFFEIDYLDYH